MMYPTLIIPEIIAISPLGIILPLFFALRPIAPARARQVAKESNVPTLYVGWPMSEAEINNRTATPVATKRLVVLDFLR